MEEIIERLKNKTFTAEDIEELYEITVKNQSLITNKKLLYEVYRLKQFVDVSNSSDIYNKVLFMAEHLGYATLYEKLKYLYNTYREFDNLIFIKSFSKTDYDIEANINNIITNISDCYRL